MKTWFCQILQTDPDRRRERETVNWPFAKRDIFPFPEIYYLEFCKNDKIVYAMGIIHSVCIAMELYLEAARYSEKEGLLCKLKSSSISAPASSLLCMVLQYSSNGERDVLKIDIMNNLAYFEKK